MTTRKSTANIFKTQKNHDNCLDHYEAHRKAIKANLEKLEAYLKSQPSDPDCDWSMVGSMGYIDEELANLVEFLGK